MQQKQGSHVIGMFKKDGMSVLYNNVPQSLFGTKVVGELSANAVTIFKTF